MDAKQQEVEASLWAGLRALDEQIELLRSLTRGAERNDDNATASRFGGRADSLQSHADTMREFLRSDFGTDDEENQG